MRTHTTAAAVLAAALLTLTACSSTKHTNPPATTPPATTKTPTKPPTTPPTTPPTSPTTTAPPTTDDAAALQQAVRAYSTAYFKPDPTAGYALLSANCKTDTDPTTYAAELNSATKTYGHQQIKTLKVNQIAGGLARVSYTYDVPVLDQTRQPWAKEDGHWRYDGC